MSVSTNERRGQVSTDQSQAWKPYRLEQPYSMSVEQNKFHSTLALDSMHGGSRRFASSYSNNNYCHLEYFDSINSSRLKVIEEHHPSEGNTKTLLCLVTLNVFNVDYH